MKFLNNIVEEMTNELSSNMESFEERAKSKIAFILLIWLHERLTNNNTSDENLNKVKQEFANELQNLSGAKNKFNALFTNKTINKADLSEEILGYFVSRTDKPSFAVLVDMFGEHEDIAQIKKIAKEAKKFVHFKNHDTSEDISDFTATAINKGAELGFKALIIGIIPGAIISVLVAIVGAICLAIYHDVNSSMKEPGNFSQYTNKHGFFPSNTIGRAIKEVTDASPNVDQSITFSTPLLV